MVSNEGMPAKQLDCYLTFKPPINTQQLVNLKFYYYTNNVNFLDCKYAEYFMLVSKTKLSLSTIKKITSAVKDQYNPLSLSQ